MKQIQVIGNLGADALTTNEEGKYTLQFNLAITEEFKNRKGETVVNTDWFTCFKNYKDEPKGIMKHLTKGARVFVQGKPRFSVGIHNERAVLNLTISVQHLTLLSFNN